MIPDNPKMGLDPEVFLEGAGGIVCPTNIIPSSKMVEIIDDAGGINRDGMALEFNPSPSANPLEVQNNLKHLMKIMSEAISSAGLSFSQSLGMSIVDMETSAKTTLPRDVFQLGCLPDYSAYTQKSQHVNIDARQFPERYAGGHIHLEIGKMPFSSVCDLVKLFDMYAGTFSVQFGDPVWSLRRRAIYGKAGSFRWKKEKGIVEYRTPDSGWMWVEDGFVKMANELSQACKAFNAGFRNGTDEAKEAIDGCNKEASAHIWGNLPRF
jgi:hypothetical protein